MERIVNRIYCNSSSSSSEAQISTALTGLHPRKASVSSYFSRFNCAYTVSGVRAGELVSILLGGSCGQVELGAGPGDGAEPAGVPSRGRDRRRARLAPDRPRHGRAGGGGLLHTHDGVV
eukprot:1193413-Prorocentrum_minimum.AAC.1